MPPPRFISGPIVIEPKVQPGDSIRFEVWDNGAFTFHLIETLDTRAKAEGRVRELSAAVAKRRSNSK